MRNYESYKKNKRTKNSAGCLFFFEVSPYLTQKQSIKRKLV